MKQLFEEAARKRHREWHWCRHWNGFLDNPLFRVIASRLNVPLYQVQAFVSRLEEFANQAEPRGYVGHFRADVFAVSLGMSADDAARIFAELEHHEVRWVDQEHIANFYDRNRDREDNTAKARKARERLRDRIRKKLAELARRGAMSPAERDGIETRLMHMPDEELDRLNVQFAHDISGLSDEIRLSTSHGMSRRDTVTVTPEKSTDFKKVTVDNSDDCARGNAAGLAKQEAEGARDLSADPDLWLTTEGARIVVERMNVPTNRALNLIERWRRDLGEHEGAVMSEIIAQASGCSNAAHFLVTVTEALRRHAVTSTLGTSLPLAPVPIGPAAPTTKPVPARPLAAVDESPDEEHERRRRHG